MNKTTKLNIMLNETPSQLDPSSSQITPKNFQIRKTFVKSPREKKQFDPITRNIYSPKTIISPKSQLGQSYLPVYTNDSSLVNGSEHNMTDTNLKGGDKNPIAVLLSKKTQNPQMVSVAALKLHLKDKEANLKSARKISFSKLSFKMNNDPSPRVSMPNRLEENQSVNTQRPHLHVAIPEFNMPKKEVKTQNSVLMNEPLISPKRMRDQLLLIKKK